MNPFKKMAIKALSRSYFDMKKYYKIHRRVQRAVNPYFKPRYKMLDHRIMVEDRVIPVRVFHPRVNEIPKVLIFFHGGGWVTGNIDSYTNICANMANQTGHRVISVDYSLAPEHPYPAGVEDCYHVTREIFSKPEVVQCSLKDITLIGDSAGGNLAAAVSLMARDRGVFLPIRQILLYPSTYNDHSESSPFPSIREYGRDYILTSKRIQDYMDMYIENEEDRYSPYVAPILSKDLSHQPDTLIITAEFDPLRDEGEAYGKCLGEFGNNVSICRIKDALHGFLALPRSSDCVVKCYEEINSFLRNNNVEK